MKSPSLVSLLFLLVVTLRATAYEPAPENLAAREWFQDAKFGLFIHWGVYSVRGEGEWVMNEKKIPIAEYEQLAPQFNPTKFDAAAWVRLAKDAGMRYITITSKHHDGFAMWQTKQSPWNIVDATPYGKDVLKLLADECQKQGMKLFFYHSHLDWHHPDYFPRGRTGLASGRPEQGDFNRYLDFMDAQLTELLTGYGPVAGIWFDGVWDRKNADWRLTQTYDLIHRLQPAALIGNNHHLAPNPGEDFQMFEKDLPGQNKGGFSPDTKIGELPLETCETINGAWGYNKNDQRFKSTHELIHYLVRSAGHNANFLLNVGPMPTGEIQPEFVERLAAMGQWLRTHGDSIYGTRGGPMAPRPWGVSTQSDHHVYVHVLDWADDLLPVPEAGLGRNPRLLTTGAPVKTTRLDGHVILHLPSTS
ncbi:MAG TPA: alpha-L-fucosidase, partial [Candidatus Synoicihabitans sp.]|nr:alpha-L-fucosidase [Candidatus Synoicihabitans sp.]